MGLGGVSRIVGGGVVGPLWMFSIPVRHLFSPGLVPGVFHGEEGNLEVLLCEVAVSPAQYLSPNSPLALGHLARGERRVYGQRDT